MAKTKLDLWEELRAERIASWDLEELRNTREAANDWSSARLSSLLPAAFHVCFAFRRERDGRWISSRHQSPRSIWRDRTLPRTSLSRCVACLAQEITTRNETRAAAAHYEECLREEETERWRRMRPSTRTLIFRQHSCVFGMTRASRWHGLLSSTQQDVLGGLLGWIVSFRVYVTATIPAPPSRDVSVRHHAYRCNFPSSATFPCPAW